MAQIHTVFKQNKMGRGKAERWGQGTPRGPLKPTSFSFLYSGALERGNLSLLVPVSYLLLGL